MLKRARIAFLVALIGATFGFIGVLDTSMAEVVFYTFMGFAVLSLLFAFFEEEARADVPHGSALQPHRIHEQKSH